MVRVPQYTDKEVLRPRGRQNVNLSINANQFGAQVGAAMEQAGGAIFDVAEAVDAKQIVEAENTAREAELEYRERERQILYDPEEGYMQQEGGNAVGGARDNAIERLKQERADIAGRISNPRARKAFERQTDKLIVSAQDTTIKHEGVEFKDFTLNTIEAVAQASMQDALRHFDDEGKFRAGIDEAARQIVKAGDLNGDSKEVTQGKLDQLLSTAEAGRVVEMARADPIAAWEYLERKGDVIDREQYNKLRSGLEPAYYGAQAREWVSRENVAAGASVDQWGNSVTAEGIPYFIIGPESSGNWNAQNPESTAGGPVQFIESTWMGLVEQLQPDWAQGKSREEILSYRYGKENRDKIGQVYREFRRQNQEGLQRYGFEITPRNEYMAHHLGLEGARLVLRAEEMGTTSSSFLGLVRASLGERTAKQWAEQNPWMQGKTVAGAIKFFDNKTAKHSGGVVNPVMAMSDAIEIKDPKLRAAVLSELELRQSVAQTTRQEEQRVAEEQAWEIIDQGGTIDDVPPELQVEVGAVVMNTIRNTIERTALGVDVTNEDRHLELIDMARDNPQEFARLNLNDDRENLSRADLLALKETQAGLADTFRQVDQQGWSSVIYTDADFKNAVSEAEDQYVAATGIRPGGAKTTQEQLQQYNRFRQQVWNGMRQFANTNQRAMTFEERTSYINTLLAPIIIEGAPDLKSGWGQGTYLFDAPTFARDGASAELQLDRYDVPASEEQRIRGQFTEQFGRAPSEDEVVEQYENELLMSVGVAPNLEYSEIPKDIVRRLKTADPSLDRAGIVDVYKSMMLEMAATNALE